MGKATKETFESNSCLLSHSMMGSPRDPNAEAAAAAVAHCGGRGLSIRDSRGSSSDGDVEGIELQGPVVIGKGKPLFAKPFPSWVAFSDAENENGDILCNLCNTICVLRCKFWAQAPFLGGSRAFIFYTTRRYKFGLHTTQVYHIRQ